MIMAEDLIKNKTVIDAHIKPFLDGTYTNYVLGNQILYDMCTHYSYHKSLDEIAAKAWIINKSYSAQLERYIAKVSDDADFYYDGIAKVLLDNGQKLDRMIDEVRGEKVNRQNIEEMFSIHSYFMSLIDKLPKTKVCGASARSFASKYLHFHAPGFFYIYDSRTSSMIPKFVKKPAKAEIEKYEKYACEKFGYENDSGNENDNDEKDSVYIEFGLRLLSLQEHINKKKNVQITPRQIDSFLLESEAHKEWFEEECHGAINNEVDE